MSSVDVIKFDSFNAQLDGAGNIVGFIHVEEMIKQLGKIKAGLDNGCIRFYSEKRRQFSKDYTHMPPISIQWTDGSRSEHTYTPAPHSNGTPVKQSAEDEKL